MTVLLGAEHKEKLDNSVRLFIFCVAFMPSLVLILLNSVEMVTLIERVVTILVEVAHAQRGISRLFGFVSVFFVPLCQMEKCLRYVVDARYKEGLGNTGSTSASSLCGLVSHSYQCFILSF